MVVGAFVLGHQPVCEQISCLVITGRVVMGLSTIMSWVGLEDNLSFLHLTFQMAPILLPWMNE
jgi:hypothetical protein